MTSAPSSSPSPPSADPAAFTRWLVDLSDADLVELLRARPDVAHPPPATIEILSGRLRLPASVQRALDALDQPALLTLALATRMGADQGAVIQSDLAERLSVAATDGDLEATLAALRKAGLTWGEGDAIHVNGAVAAVVAQAPVVVPVPGDVSGEALAAAHDGLGAPARGMLRAISTGRVPSGTLSGGASAQAREAVAELVDAGLVALDADGTTVRPTAAALDVARHGRTGPSLLAAPEWPGRDQSSSDTDAAAGVTALDLLHRCERLLDVLGAAPAAALKAGGVGVRELRRIARSSGIDEGELPLLLEVLAASGLIAFGDCEVGDTAHDDVWAPTDSADVWATKPAARRWAELVLAWWRLPARPWRMVEGGAAAGGSGGSGAAAGSGSAAGEPIRPLSESGRAPAAMLERRRLLTALATVPAGRAPEAGQLGEIVRWRWPAWFARGGGELAAHTAGEAQVLGVVVGATPTSLARWLVRGEGAGAGGAGDSAVGAKDAGADAEVPRPDVEVVADLLAAALPVEVSEVIVQADNTILAPGPLTAELAADFALLAEIESAGAATTYRVTEASLRRALDSGRTAAALVELLKRTSITPLPQSLTYLIEDVARRHGRLRIGAAVSFCRCEDAALLAQVAATDAAQQCAARLIAPTVLVAQVSPIELVDMLRGAGFAPVVEDSSGAVVSLGRRVARIRPGPETQSRGQAAVIVSPSTPGDAELRQAVATMRSADALRARRGEGKVRTGEAAVAFLHDAAREARPVAVSVVDASGRSETRLLVPAVVSGGRLEGVEPESAQPVRLALHRVISVAEVEAER